jgi:hypothetical protein
LEAIFTEGLEVSIDGVPGHTFINSIEAYDAYRPKIELVYNTTTPGIKSGLTTIEGAVTQASMSREIP